MFFLPPGRSINVITCFCRCLSRIVLNTNGNWDGTQYSFIWQNYLPFPRKSIDGRRENETEKLQIP